MRELRSRGKAQPPLARVMFEALSDPVADQARREWLHLEDGEVPPRVLEAVRPGLVVWASLWPHRLVMRSGSTSRMSALPGR